MKWIPPQIVVVEVKDKFKNKNKFHFKGPVQPSGGSASTTHIPETFNNASEMVKFMSAHILEEGRMSLNSEFQEHSNRDGVWTRPTFVMNLRSCTAVDHTSHTSNPPYQKTYEFGFDVQKDKDDMIYPPVNLGEVYVVHSPSWTKTKCCIGLIGPNDVNTIFLQDQKIYDDEQSAPFALWMCITSGEQGDTGWLTESDLPSFYPDGSVKRETMYALNIGTVTNLTREYEGLKSLAHIKDHLKKAIFCKRNQDLPASVTPHAPTVWKDSSSFATPFAAGKEGFSGGADGFNTKSLENVQVNKPASVPRGIWDKLSLTLNPFQLLAIGNIISGRSKGNFVLLQGPPGTGKTTTIIGLVTALLNGSSTLPGGKVSGTRVQIGNTLSRQSDDGNNNTATLNVPVARRILVCAPSNTAVDDLAWRLHKLAVGPNGALGGFNIVRFGQAPGEERHDRRGKGRKQRTTQSSVEGRDEYLREINLDLIVESIARVRGTGDFADHDGNKRLSKNINYGQERRQILTKCHVVCTTLSGAGSKAFAESVSRDEFHNSEFDAVIIDEACQASEPSSLIPLKYNPNIVVMVGDPQQLPVLLFSQSSKRAHFGRSLFERLQLNGWPVNVLRMQYRMHDEIVRFPSMHFYSGQLITSSNVRGRGLATWSSHPCFPPYRFWNLNKGIMKRSAEGGVSNQDEYMFIRRLLNEFGILFNRVRPISIGIISFYNDQVELLKRSINSLPWIKSGKISLQISTVDGFQGSEKDIIILSCVRSSSSNKPFNRGMY
uniref:Helicase ATP-binding domain-containing protein n=1 Tax=Ditylum brightwellii TaxID=49249 RepID=A0A7S4S262_9STRA